MTFHPSVCSTRRRPSRTASSSSTSRIVGEYWRAVACRAEAEGEKADDVLARGRESAREEGVDILRSFLRGGVGRQKYVAELRVVQKEIS